MHVFSSVPNDPTSNQRLNYSVQASMRRVTAGPGATTQFLDIHYQVDFATPYTFQFIGGADGEITFSFTTSVLQLQPMSTEKISSSSQLIEAQVCSDFSCNTTTSANVISFIPSPYPNPILPILSDTLFGGSLVINNNSLINAEALRWTIRVPLQIPIVQLAGDFNQDNVVNVADYAFLRDTFGSSLLQANYHTWKSHFGASATSALATDIVVPEPTICSFIAFACWIGCCRFSKCVERFTIPTEEFTVNPH